MQTLIIQPSTSAHGRVVRCRPPAVYVDGLLRSDLEVLHWEWAAAPTFGQVTLAASPQPPRGAPRAERIGALPPVGAAVWVVDTARATEFLGVVAAHQVELDAQHERLVARVDHELVSLLAAPITSLWQSQEGGIAELRDTRVAFNTADGQCSAATGTLGGRECRLFSAQADAGRWSVADALGYLLATAVPGGMDLPALAELDAMASGVDLGSLDVTGLTAAEALRRVAAVAGLELRSVTNGRGLVAYRPGIEGRPVCVRLAKAGAAADTGGGLWQARVEVGRRPSRRGVLALGGPRQYEVTLTLRPGWDAARQTARWRDFSPSMSDNWPVLSDVYRKWVLNEHGWYAGDPWNLPTHSLADISASDFPLRRPRRLLPCLSLGIDGRSLGVVVEFRLGATAAWRRWRGPLHVLRDECGVWLGGDGLPGEYFAAALAAAAEVRVTAVIEADARLSIRAQGDAGAGLRVIDVGTRAAWRQVHSSSVFHGRADLPAPAQRDDTAMLQAIALRHVEAAADATRAELTIAWVDTAFHVGDIIDGIYGRGISLAGSTTRRPAIVAVRHDYGSTQTTRLTVSG